jgi:hypothetical protein
MSFWSPELGLPKNLCHGEEDGIIPLLPYILSRTSLRSVTKDIKMPSHNSRRLGFISIPDVMRGPHPL